MSQSGKTPLAELRAQLQAMDDEQLAREHAQVSLSLTCGLVGSRQGMKDAQRFMEEVEAEQAKRKRIAARKARYVLGWQRAAKGGE